MKNEFFTKLMLIIIAVGVWILVLDTLIVGRTVKIEPVSVKVETVAPKKAERYTF